MLLVTAAAPPLVKAKGCQAVTRDKCGTHSPGKYDSHSCLKCGTQSDYDCEECCPGCSQIVKGTFKYCQCGSAPSPPPSGGDTWANYKVAGMEIISVIGGKNQSYEKVVVMLHGGGESGSMWEYQYNQGWLGNLSGLKYVFPTTAFSSHVWYHSYKKPGCGLNNDCAYNISSIEESASRVAALIEHEKALVGGEGSKVFLAGFSEGAQLTGYMQLAKLSFALGGTIIMDGFPLPPLFDMPGHDPSAAKANATYYGSDMRWMIWHGSKDPIFPCNYTLTYWDDILGVLGASATLKIRHTEPGMTHTLVQPELEQMVNFVRGKVSYH